MPRQFTLTQLLMAVALVAIVLTGIVSYTALNVSDPIAVGVNSMGDSMFWLRPIIKIAAIAGLSSVILVMLLGVGQESEHQGCVGAARQRERHSQLVACGGEFVLRQA